MPERGKEVSVGGGGGHRGVVWSRGQDHPRIVLSGVEVGVIGEEGRGRREGRTASRAKLDTAAWRERARERER